MSKSYVFVLCLFYLLLICCHAEPQASIASPSVPQSRPTKLSKTNPNVLVSDGNTLPTRFPTPHSYVRSEVTPESFASYLRQFPLHHADRKVQLYNGELKSNQAVHAAVLNIDVGSRDLQQCADAIMRLRAEYLFKNGRFDEIEFHFVNGFLAEYDQWRIGKGISVSGNKAKWIPSQSANKTRKSFDKYLQMVFSYAGTPSLEKELKSKPISDISAGDVLIQGGSPGHAILVMDIAEHKSTGNKLFLLAQSYMPAQDIHVLINPSNDLISPWYSLSEITDQIRTPEWTFYPGDLKSF